MTVLLLPGLHICVMVNPERGLDTQRPGGILRRGSSPGLSGSRGLCGPVWVVNEVGAEQERLGDGVGKELEGGPSG